MLIELGHEVCSDLHAAERREWLVTNGIGGFASGTVAGLPTRHYHAVTHAGDWQMDIQPIDDGISVTAFPGAQVFYLRCPGATVNVAHDWYRNCDLVVERERGLEDREDMLHAVTFELKLEPSL